MTEKEWNAFCKFRDEYKKCCNEYSLQAKELQRLQKLAADEDKVPEYPLENAVVYNKLYDEITEQDEIKLIVIGDNPGKDEQLNKNQKYLVGQSGKIAEGFFRKNSQLQIDFRKNAIIVNKTPVHTAKTKELKFLEKNGSENIKKLIEESQKKMAHLTAELHRQLQDCQLWIVGYSELKEKKIFDLYRKEFSEAYTENGVKAESWNRVFVYQHFSMNRFLIDLRENWQETETLSGNLEILGAFHRREIFQD